MPIALYPAQRSAPQRHLPSAPLAMTAVPARLANALHQLLCRRHGWPVAKAAQKGVTSSSRHGCDTLISPPMLFRSEGFAEDLLDPQAGGYFPAAACVRAFTSAGSARYCWGNIAFRLAIFGRSKRAM